MVSPVTYIQVTPTRLGPRYAVIHNGCEVLYTYLEYTAQMTLHAYIHDESPQTTA